MMFGRFFRLAGLGLVVLAGAAGSGAQISNTTSEREMPVVVERDAHVFYTGRGQFEIIVIEIADAREALELGRSVWSALSAPLGLPGEGFDSPVAVRLVPAEMWNEPAVFTVTVEPGGLVSVRVRWSEDIDPIVVRRAFVQGVIMRQAVAWHAVGPHLKVPLWLEQACTAWSQVRERPAMMDAFQQEAAAMGTPPPLRSLLEWERGEVESRNWELSALWLFAQLQAEGPFSRWGGWLRGILGGAASYETLPRSYTGLWSDAASLELWWRTVVQHQCTARALPGMTSAVSRAWMQDRSRWLAGRGGREVVLRLEELLELRREPWVKDELNQRLLQTRAVLGLIHPYYANAALAMGRLYEAALRGNEKSFGIALADFERDAIDGRELEDTVGAILNTAPRK
jgi:hypothetical protein